MTDNERDESVRRTFEELREEDRRALPPFEQVLARSSGATAPRGANHRTAWLAAAIVLIAAGVGLIAVRDLGRPLPVPTVEAAGSGLVAWESPTGRLLLTTGKDLIGVLPRVGAFDFGNLDSGVARTKVEGSAPLRR